MTQFYGKTKICYGNYALDTLENLLAKRAFIVTDPFMVKSGFKNQIVSHLDRCRIAHSLFDSVEPDPSLETVTKGAAHFIQSESDLIIALGGGSAIDAAKAIAFFSGQARPEIQKPLFVAIPTTSGTGSEVTSISVITDKKNDVKIPLNDERLIPDIAILDARFTRTVPPHVTAATGMDVFTHALEAYISRQNNAFSSIFAEQAAQYVFRYLLRAYKCMEDMEAREMMLLGSCMAGMAFSNSGLGITHSIAHSLGGLFHIPHGLANAVLLTHVIRFNAFDAGVRYKAMASLLGLPANTVEEGTNSLLQAVSDLNSAMGIPCRIRDLKIEHSQYQVHIDTMAKNALEDICTVGNPRRPSHDDIRCVLESAW